MMMKFGRDTSPIHIACMAHAIHLCICDVIYKAKKNNDSNDNTDHESDEEEDGEDLDLDLDQEQDDEETAIVPEYNKIIAKVKKTVKLFRMSPVSNDDCLQPGNIK